jgi:c-di-GMP-binding flagellar brake protein YcgR
MAALLSKEKRHFPRINFKAPLHYQIYGSGEPQDTSAEDISLGGMGFIDQQFLAPGSIIRLAFNVFSRYVQATGRIAWSQVLPHSDRYRIGIEFQGLDAKAKKDIKDFIEIQTAAV